MPTASGNPPLTGERTWPGITCENYWFMRHLACYRWAAAQLAQRAATSSTHLGPVVDAGAGEGYGSDELTRALGCPVVAVELDAPTACHAGSHYPALAIVRANLVELPFRTGSFQAAVSLQVVEHIWDPLAYLRELSRCSIGPVILSTPNRPVHSPHLQRGQRPDNPFHVREFDALELTELLEAADDARTPTWFGLRHGTRITQWEDRNGSLPHALFLDPEDADPVTAFASTLSDTDFLIEQMNPQDTISSVLDLVAIW